MTCGVDIDVDKLSSLSVHIEKKAALLEQVRDGGLGGGKFNELWHGVDVRL
jgi:hypothetical protein